MKFLIILSLLSMSAYISAEFSSEACQWQTARNDLVEKLTPAGQEAAIELAKGLQVISGAAIQPVYLIKTNSIWFIFLHFPKVFEYLIEKHGQELDAINGSSDASKLKQLADLLGVGNYGMGFGDLHDVCQFSKDLEALVGTFSEDNQKLVGSFLKDFGKGYKMLLKPLMAINGVLNHELLEQLEQSEDKATLGAIAKLYGQE